jgi:hypothetical protein
MWARLPGPPRGPTFAEISSVRKGACCWRSASWQAFGRTQVVSRTQTRVPHPIAASGQKRRGRALAASPETCWSEMSSRPPFTPEPQKRDGQILVANRIASEAVVRIVPSNSFDRCNYATSASDRRLHEVFNWCPRSNSRTLTRLGLAGWHFPPRHPCRPVQQSKVDRASGDLVRLLRG